MPAPIGIWLGVLLMLLTAFAAVTLESIGSAGLQDAFGRWIYDTIVVGAALAVLIRAATHPSERAAWLALGIGLLLWALGQTYYSIALYYASPAPFPSPADALFLAFYPASFLALALLLRARAAHVESLAWVDGLIGALAVAAVAAALIFPPVLDALGGSPLGVGVSLAYPCADLVLLGLVAGAFAASEWRARGTWLLIAAALLLFGISDVVYLSVGGQSTQALNLASIGWPLAFVLLAAGAWLRGPPVRREPSPSGRRIAMPIALATVVIGLLAIASFVPVGATAVALGVASLLAVLVRLAITFNQNMRMLTSSRRDAITDVLTGLGNRRRLMTDLERALAPGGADAVLVLYDLDGFKAYNDSFGHAAGDVLLRRLGAQLKAAVQPHGAAYRLGGDEFCVVESTERVSAEVVARAGEDALSARGAGFAIGASWGMVRLPTDATIATGALRLADRRMYTQKGRRTGSALSQARGVLLGMLREREPELDRHMNVVADLAARMGRELRLDAEELDVLVRAAEMHDVGKIAIPDEVLHKVGPLSDTEWELMRKHTVIGERVLAAAPALSGVAKLVRATHEQWDGSGYPDGLAGDQIPIGARIILICDAYNAMTHDRPYGEPFAPGETLSELHRHAGTQFDPDLVKLFVERIAPRAAAAAASV